MSSTSFASLITKFPDERDAIQRLLAIFSDGQRLTHFKEFTIQRLFDLAAPKSEFVLAQILNHLVKNGCLRKIVRVESPSLGGLCDYSSITEIPDVIQDWRRDIEMHVTLDNIRIIYQVTSSFDIAGCSNGN